MIYFYPDELLKHLRNLIDTEAATPDADIAKGAEILARTEDVDKALNFITSTSVATNLKFTVAMIEELRHIADYKEGVRASLHAIFFSWMFERDRNKIVELAKDAHHQIEFVNSKIKSLESSVGL